MIVDFVFSVLATVLNIMFNVPQLIRTYKTKNVVALSKKTIVLRILCSSCWAVYSALLQEWLFFSTCILNILSEIFLLVAKIKYHEIKDTKKIIIAVEHT